MRTHFKYQVEYFEIARQLQMILFLTSNRHLQIMNEEAGFQTIKQIRARDFVYNDVHVFKEAPEDFYCKLMVKYC